MISNTLFFASFERMDQLIKDFTFHEVQSPPEIRPPCLTEQGFGVIHHGYFCNNGVNLTYIEDIHLKSSIPRQSSILWVTGRKSVVGKWIN